jgi:hypothetical protein
VKAETKTLLVSLLAAARSDDASSHAQVLQQLQDAKALDTLDSEQDYVNAAAFRLRVAQVTEALAKNPAPSATQSFLALTKSELFMAHDERIIALVRNSVHIRPAPPRLIEFLDQYSQPEDGFTPTTITCLLDNGSPPAVELFKRKMVDPSHEDNDKIAWMRTRVLPHRNDLPLLVACEQLLQGELVEHLQPPLVDVLFDYQPANWFRPSSTASPPLLQTASNEALDQLSKTAATALTMVRLTPEQRHVVKSRMELAEQLKADRHAQT